MNAITNGVIISGIIITLVILWLSLRRYEGYFSEKKLFLSFLAGMAMGFVVIVIEFLTSEINLLMAILVFPTIEQLSKLMILNYRAYREKRDAPIYGLAVGLGFGAIFVPISALVMIKGQVLDISFILASLLGGLAIIFLHGVTGSMLGYGVCYMDGERRWQYFALSVIATIPVRPILVIPFSIIYMAAVILLAYAVIIYLYATPKLLVLALPRKERRRK